MLKTSARRSKKRRRVHGFFLFFLPRVYSRPFVRRTKFKSEIGVYGPKDAAVYAPRVVGTVLLCQRNADGVFAGGRHCHRSPNRTVPLVFRTRRRWSAHACSPRARGFWWKNKKNCTRPFAFFGTTMLAQQTPVPWRARPIVDSNRNRCVRAARLGASSTDDRSPARMSAATSAADTTCA